MGCVFMMTYFVLPYPKGSLLMIDSYLMAFSRIFNIKVMKVMKDCFYLKNS